MRRAFALHAIFLCVAASTCLNASTVRSALGGIRISAVQRGQAPAYTSADYVQDGLLCMWDGIENVGLGEHDDASQVWVDLSGNGFDLTVDLSCGEWGTNCIVPYSNCGCPAYRRNAQAEFNALKMYPVQIEAVTKGPMSAGSGTARLIVGLTYCDGQYQQMTSMYSYIGKRGRGWPVPVTQQPQAFSVNLDAGYANGEFCGTSFLNIGFGSWGRFGSDICVAGVVQNDSSSDRTRGYQYPYPIYAIRVCSRELNEEEVVLNWTVDKARFGL